MMARHQGTYHESGKQEVNAASHGRTVHLEAGERDDGGDDAHRGIVAAREETIGGQHNTRSPQGRRQAARKFTDASQEPREGCDKPMEHRRFEGDFIAIVDGKNPVAVLQHRHGHNGFAGLAARIEGSGSEKPKEGDDAEDQQRNVNFRSSWHNG